MMEWRNKQVRYVKCMFGKNKIHEASTDFIL